MSTTNTANPKLAQIQISEWRARENKTLRGFFTITLPSGMIIHDCMLHEKDNRCWIGLPRREYESQGERKFVPIISFIDRATEARFHEQVLVALNQQRPWEQITK